VAMAVIEPTLGGEQLQWSRSDSTNDTLLESPLAINSAQSATGGSRPRTYGNDGAHLLLSSSLSDASIDFRSRETDGWYRLLLHSPIRAATSPIQAERTGEDGQLQHFGHPYTRSSNDSYQRGSPVSISVSPGDGAGASNDAVASERRHIENQRQQRFVRQQHDATVAGLASGSYEASSARGRNAGRNPLLRACKPDQSGARQRSSNTRILSLQITLASVGITTNNDGH